MTSLIDLHDADRKDLTHKQMDSEVRKIIREIINGLRCVYGPSDTEEAGRVISAYGALGSTLANDSSYLLLDGGVRTWRSR